MTESIRRLATSKLPLSLRCSTRHRPSRRRLAALRGAPSAGRWSLASKASLAALFHILSKLPHRLLRDDSSFATCERSFGVVKSRQEFRPLALAFFPQRQRFVHRLSLPKMLSGANAFEISDIERTKLDRASGYEPMSKNYKPFLWRRLRATPYVSSLLNCTEDVPKYRSSDSARAETSNLSCTHECRSCLVRRYKSYCATAISSNGLACKIRM